jgi:hypothetical protein
MIRMNVRSGAGFQRSISQNAIPKAASDGAVSSWFLVLQRL